jgi:excisionase family DNA binding protein
MPETTITLERLSVAVPEAAQALACSTRTIRRLVRSGALQARRHGRAVLIDAASLRAYWESLPETKHAPIVVCR